MFPRWTALLEAVRVIASEEERDELTREILSGGDNLILGFVNAHAMNCLGDHSQFFQSLLRVDTLLRDGSGMGLLFRAIGRDGGLNMNGTDYIPKLLAAARGMSVAVYGTREPYLSRAVQRLTDDHGLNVVSHHHGFMPVEHYVRLVDECRPNIVLLGMGMPKQEILASHLKARVPDPKVVICGGAILDFLAGRVSRAPVWMRMVGMEWAYRLLLEPKRLFRRYVVGNPLFVYRLLRYRLALPEWRPY